MIKLEVLIYDSIHDTLALYTNVYDIEIKYNVFKLKSRDASGQHIFVFSNRYSIHNIAIIK